MFAKCDRSKIKPIKLPTYYSRLDRYQKYEVRERYIQQQKGLCHYCESPLDKMPDIKIRGLRVNPDLFPEDFFKHPIHLHHNHDTDMTIGAVHCHCNAVMWEHDGE